MTRRMNHAIENRALIAAHSFKSNTSKERPVLASADGRCEKCGEAITYGTAICWHRKFGVFHAQCYRTLNVQEQESGSDGITEQHVRALIDDAMSSVKVDVSPLRTEIQSRVDAAQAVLAAN